MISESDLMIEDSIRRNDLFQQMATCGGFGVGAFLAGDRADELDRLRQNYQPAGRLSGKTECFEILDQMAAIQIDLYEERYRDGWRRCESLNRSLRHFPMQCIRVIQNSLSALTGLHRLDQDGSLAWKGEVLRHTKRLRAEKLPYSIVLADFYEGVLCAMLSCQGFNYKSVFRGKSLLSKAIDQAQQQELRPLQLAAIDTINELSAQADPLAEPQDRSLLDLMRDQGIVYPEKLARLYTVDLKPIR